MRTQIKLPRDDERSPSSEKGSLLIDVLTGMAIFALLVLIAIGAWDGYRMRVYMYGVVNDAKNLGSALTADPGLAPAAYSPGKHRAAARVVKVDITSISDPVAWSGEHLSKGDRVIGWAASGDGEFTFCVEHLTGDTINAWAAYRSDRGGIYDRGHDAAGCPGFDHSGLGEDPYENTPPPTATATATPTPTASSSSTPLAGGGASSGTDPSSTGTSGSVAPSPTSTSTAPAPPYWTPPQSADDVVALCSDQSKATIVDTTDDVIYGTPGPDVIFGGNRGQTIYGLGGDDLICGGNGKDVLYGGSGSDVIYGNNGKDTLYGGSGIDYLYGNNAKDTLYAGGDGFQDFVFGNNGPDIFFEDGPDNPDNDQFTQ